MNVRELIQELEGLDPETEVRIAEQPHWPFEYSVDSIVVVTPAPLGPSKEKFDKMTEEQQDVILRKMDEGKLQDPDDPNAKTETIVYIGEGRQLGYLPGNVKDELDWR